jgi:D-glycero-D-manno-heptose 1,7-bisphosphate phosphatase
MDGSSRRAVFLDRDGVLNRNVFYPDSGRWESPRTAADFAPVPGAGAALLRLRAAGLLLFVVSNQPNAAKKKCSFDDLLNIDAKLQEYLVDNAVEPAATYYCFHHPDFTGHCVCRKPEPYFLSRAQKEFALDLSACWMIGDRGTDMECGRRAGTRTVWIDNQEGEQEPAAADFKVRSLSEAADTILAEIRQKASDASGLARTDDTSGAQYPG